MTQRFLFTLNGANEQLSYGGEDELILFLRPVCTSDFAILVGRLIARRGKKGQCLDLELNR
jgi:hypothetical protein